MMAGPAHPQEHAPHAFMPHPQQHQQYYRQQPPTASSHHQQQPQQQPSAQPQTPSPTPTLPPTSSSQEAVRGSSPRTDEEDCGEEEEAGAASRQGAGVAAPAVPSAAAAAAAATVAATAATNGGSGGRRLVSGLSSGVGQNTCYLNVVVQSLWGLRAFRDRILGPHTPSSSDAGSADAIASQLEQALRAVMAGLSRLEEGRGSPVPPWASAPASASSASAVPNTPPRSPQSGGVSVDGLREALSARAGRKFRAGHMDDAVEAFEEILECLGKGGGGGQLAVAEAFTLHLREVMLCPGCGRASPYPARDYDTNVFYVPVRSLMEAASWGRVAAGGNGRKQQQQAPAAAAAAALDFGALLQGAGSGDLYGCGHGHEGCPVARRGEKHAGHRYLVRRPPQVFSLALVWDTLRGDSREIQAILGLIEPVLRLGHFRLPPAAAGAHAHAEAGMGMGMGPGEYVGLLQGFFAFHPQKHHYVCFLARHPAAAAGGWVCLDDSEVHVLGPSHAEALRQCAEQQYQPSLLFYEVALAQPQQQQQQGLPPQGP